MSDPLVAKWLGHDVHAFAHVGPWIAAIALVLVLVLAIRINRSIAL